MKPSKLSVEHNGFKVDWCPTRFISLYSFSVAKGTYTEKSVLCDFTEPELAIEEAIALIDMGFFDENYSYYLKDTGMKE